MLLAMTLERAAMSWRAPVPWALLLVSPHSMPPGPVRSDTRRLKSSIALSATSYRELGGTPRASRCPASLATSALSPASISGSTALASWMGSACAKRGSSTRRGCTTTVRSTPRSCSRRAMIWMLMVVNFFSTASQFSSCALVMRALITSVMEALSSWALALAAAKLNCPDPAPMMPWARASTAVVGCCIVPDCPSKFLSMYRAWCTQIA
mmetsp:Transcript_21238/g.54003  ORF Transcript_21238/g.54003 Transcript_21238/m.54003 type:complete len:210 (-) Transcript_21238:58-687(-)